MKTLELYQNYWWLLIAVLGGALVFMLFVQGGQTLLAGKKNEKERRLMVSSLGHKWELGFTTLVVFGGAFFASFPLYYSTSFGGAYWLWMLILLSFVVQATAYEFRSKRGNVYGGRFYDAMLLINGCAGPVLLGVAVAMMFFGGAFTIDKANLATGANPVISVWMPTHGLEAILNWRCLLFGFTIFFLARTLAGLWFINDIPGDEAFGERMRKGVFSNGIEFTVLFLAFCFVLLTADGLRQTAGGEWELVPNLYFHNLTRMWWWGLLFLTGAAGVLWGIYSAVFTDSRKGIWPAGAGTVLVTVSLFAIAGYGGTAYLPSTLDAASSLTLANSSSSLFTLKVMSWVSLLIPFVIAYIVIVWRKMGKTV